MAWTTYDLSEITDQLVNQLKVAAQNSPLWTSEGGTIPNFQINVTGTSPDMTRNGQEGECQLNLYLLHVAQNPYLRNTPIFGISAMANNQQPLSLDLTYLLTAYTKDNAEREQQAMSIALSWFHENPISANPPIATFPAGEYLTINLGADTLSEMSALWQSFAVAYRLSTIYRVAVAMLTPSLGPGTAKNPSTVNLVVAPAAAPLDVTPQVFQTARQIVFTIPPTDTTNDPTAVTEAVGSLSIVGGQPVMVGGQGLSATPAIDVFLATVDGATSWIITGWVTGADLPSDLVMLPPATYAVGPAAPPPGSTPPPGVYLLSVGTATSQSPPAPVMIVPRFDSVTTPPVLPLPPPSGIYTVTGAGFVPGATQLYVGGVALAAMTPTDATPNGPGFFSVSKDGASLAFIKPAGLPAGLAVLRVRVNGVEAPPTWRVP
jgi:hypothetical protein